MYFVYSCTVLRANIQNRKTSVFAYGPASRMYFRHAQRGAYRTAISAAQILVIIQKYKYQQHWAHTTYNGHVPQPDIRQWTLPGPHSPGAATVPRCNLLSTFLQWFYVDKCPTLSTCCKCQKAFYGRYHALACTERYCFTNCVRPSVRPSHCGTVYKRMTSSNFFPPPRVRHHAVTSCFEKGHCRYIFPRDPLIVGVKYIIVVRGCDFQ